MESQSIRTWWGWVVANTSACTLHGVAKLTPPSCSEQRQLASRVVELITPESGFWALHCIAAWKPLCSWEATCL